MNFATNRKAASKKWLSLSIRAMMLFMSRTVRIEETTIKDLKDTFWTKMPPSKTARHFWIFYICSFNNQGLNNTLRSFHFLVNPPFKVKVDFDATRKF
jgi:hypothetical protein